MSFFYGLDTEAYDRDYSDGELIARIFGYFVPHRRRVRLQTADHKGKRTFHLIC